MAGEPRALDQLRSGLCHGPDCQAKITEKSPSPDFHNDACQARWQASLVDARPFGCEDLCELPDGHFGYCAWITAPHERVEALRPDLSLGARHHLTGGDYVVTESEPGRAVLTPVDVARLFQIPERLLGIPKPIRRSWWKPNTWRRNG